MRGVQQLFGIHAGSEVCATPLDVDGALLQAASVDDQDITALADTSVPGGMNSYPQSLRRSPFDGMLHIKDIRGRDDGGRLRRQSGIPWAG
ncbi:hypothetical protein A4X20_28090 [Mycolicibacterium iranicum]|uniref:Uncharacterized protein n=1 Tax=Mycolicibacterium iranicum TaxID=912594 RepID=A0A178LNR0_MYCIR|nr:hypothetical protein A4X20_28090 [Mycolicibacterium iranicum]